MNWQPRLACLADVPELERLIPLSVRVLQAPYYSPAQMEAAFGPVFGVDRQLIEDGTYFVIEEAQQIIACGGWSRRKSLFGGGAGGATAESLLNPAKDAARVRAFFVHPDWARRGLGKALLLACENAIRAAGFHRIELVATLAGVPLYRAHGYVEELSYEIPLSNGLGLPAVRMTKQLITGK